MKKGFRILAAVLALTAVLAGCGMKATDVPYADDMAENMLQGMSQNDYAVFSRDFSDVMKESINEEAFAAMVEQFSPIIGTYESKTFYQAANTKQNDVEYTVVMYKAKFTDEDEVLVTVTFSGEDDSKVVDGLFFTSPKLREAAASASA